MAPSENNKIKHYLLQILSFILTLIISTLAVVIVVHVMHIEKYYPVTYFLVYGAVYIFIKYYFTKLSNKGKYLYLIVIVLGIIIFFQTMISLPKYENEIKHLFWK